ncbi:MAG TPA: Xaa-Pro peptidase family protein [Armatimonadota bacterium]|jgi:Xaa-Pro aminopeptidase
MNTRLNALRAKFDSAGIDALYVSNIVNVRYLTGFTGSTAMLFVTRDNAFTYVDSRYWLQAESQVTGAEVVRCGVAVTNEALESVAALPVERLGYEAGNLTVSALDKLSAKLPDMQLVKTDGLVEGLRLVKDASEVAAVQAACALTDALFEEILGFIKPGVREVDIALELEYRMRKRGAQEVGFASIIASGANGAKPHAGASDKAVESGDLLTMDFGARLNGYNSDITRTVAVGAISDEQRAVYGVVLKAQETAVAALRPGVSCVEADKVARDIIAEAGYGENFGHGLGHSLGLDVHDGARLSPLADPESVVQAGEIWTIEPGIYIPGWCGVRIEDDVLVTEDGPVLLTHAPKGLIVL